MNIYHIDSGDKKYFSRKIDAQIAAQEQADKIQKEVVVSKLFVAVDRENIARMANKEMGFTKYIARVGSVPPRKRPKVKLRNGFAAIVLVLLLLLPNLANAASCTVRRSGSVNITSCSGKGFSSHCRSYRSGSVVKTYCR